MLPAAGTLVTFTSANCVPGDRAWNHAFAALAAETRVAFTMAVDGRAYTVDMAIDTLTLPEATGGNGELTYSLTPSVPGLTFDAAAKRTKPPS